MGFQPGEKYQTAVDKRTGALIEIRPAGLSFDVTEGTYTLPEGDRVVFSIRYRTRTDGPNAIIDMPDIDKSLRSLRRSREESERIVADIIEGVVAIEREWPMMQRAWFGTNYDEYSAKGYKFIFSKPSDARLTELSGR